MAKQAQSKEKILDKMLKSGLTEKVRVLCWNGVPVFAVRYVPLRVEYHPNM
jgi:hypothetical protein